MAGHDAGSGGAIDAGEVCSSLESDYEKALIEAKQCHTMAMECQLTASTSISCPGCSTHVQSTTKLNELSAQWTAAGCKRGLCPAIACRSPGVGLCVSADGGSVGTCEDSPILP